MKLTSEIKTLKLKYPFKTARSDDRSESDSLIVKLEKDGFIGYGEIRPSEYYFGENFEVSSKVLNSAADIIDDNPFLLEDILEDLKIKFPYAPSTLAGIDIALHDLVGKLLNIPLYQYFGLNKEKTPVTSFTIGLDNIPMMVKKIKEAKDYPIIKVKVGTPNDIEIMKAIREHTDAIIRVDANTGWGVDEAIENINRLEEFNIEFIEQPIEPGNFEGLRKIKENVNIPIMADEDVVNSNNIPNLIGCVDAINIKLMKCGGIREALRMINIAKAHGMKIMLGCMLESSIGNAAAAQISPLVDYADLDTFLLITNDPYTGLGDNCGKLFLSDKPGLGIIEV
ncbi:MAG TPA: dipeptide epimerase [Victivallales bacterium]|nr:dipeptide epimerase [Victivallales bacterium]